jgi:hypothetical protein
VLLTGTATQLPVLKILYELQLQQFSFGHGYRNNILANEYNKNEVITFFTQFNKN